jgi:RHS repeat-associated protein
MPVLSNVRVPFPLQPPPKECFYWMDYVFQDATGGRHSLGLSWVYGNGNESLCPCPSQKLSGGDDYFQAALSGASNQPATIADAAGTVYTFSSSGTQGHADPNNSAITSSLPTSIEDRNGNQISVTDNGSGSFTVTDPLGRPLLSSSGFGVSGNTLAVAGLQSAYTITWETISPNFSIGSWLMFDAEDACDSSLAPDEGTTINVIKSIELPNGQSYQFSYNDPYGMLSQITYPTGGYVQYTWGVNGRSESASFEDTRGEQNACQYQRDAPAVTARMVGFQSGPPALTQIFSYSPTAWNGNPINWTTKTTTVTTTDNITGAVSATQYTYIPILPPGQPNEARQFAAQLPLEQTTTYENSAGTAVHTVTKAWYDQYELKSQQTLLNDSSNNLTNQTTYAYGAGAQVTDKQEYDYGPGGPPSTPLRETVTTYQAFNHTPLFAGLSIFNQPCRIKVYSGSQTSGTLQSETDYYYDNGGTGTVCGTAGIPSVTGVSNLTEHDETNYSASSTYPRGNVTTMVKQCFQGTTACTLGNPTTTYTYDETGQRLSMTDPNLNVTNYSFTDSYLSTNTGSYTTTAGSPPSGKVTNAYLTKITYPATGTYSHVENFTYGFNDGSLTTSTDENSQVTTYRYNDNFDRPTEADYPDGGQTDHVYNDSPPSPSVTTCQLISGTASATCSPTSPPTGWKTTEALMDGLGHVVQTQLPSDPDGNTYTATTYDGFNRPYTVTNPYRSTSDLTYGVSTKLYDALGRSCLVVPSDFSSGAPTSCPATAPLGSTFTSYSGNLTTVTDEVGNQRTSQTDGLGRLTEVWEAPNVTGYNYPTLYQYDALNDLTNVTQNGNNSANARIRSFVYDSLARLTSAANPESGTITYSYDLDSNLSSKVAPKPGATGTAKTTTNYSYDALNRLTQKSYEDPLSATALYGYDGAALSGCSTGVPSITSPTYLVGRRSAMCQANSSSAFSYDSMGRPLVEARTNRGSSAKKYTTGYAYYKDGSLNTLTYPSGDIVTYTVGGAGRTTQASDASNSYVGYSGSTASYAPHGSLAGMTNGYTSSFAGIVTWNAYNNRLQPILLSASTGAQVSTSITSASYPGCPSGLVCAVIFNVSSSSGINVGDEFTVSGNSTSFFNGDWIVSAVAAGQVQADSGESSSQSCSSTCGTLQGYTTPPIFSLCYDFHLGVAVGACNLSAYPSGNNGNVFQVLNNVNSTRSAAYAYDPLNRISQANTTTVSSNCWGETYTIDAWGNLTNIAGLQSMPTCNTENLAAAPASVQNQLNGYCYDAAGNLALNTTCPTGTFTPTYVYDAENRLTGTAGYTYSYDADGTRMEKTNGSSGTMYWPGPSGEVLAETSLTGTINEEYVYFNNSRIARVDRPSGGVHYYFPDQLGSASIITDASGNIQETYYYYPYGGLVSSTGSDPNNYKFTGKERDTESGLDNFGARHNASALGRFMSIDPSRLSIDRSNPQSWNRYSYAYNDPLKFVDHNGKWPTKIHNQIIDAAFPGLSTTQRDELKRISAWVDRIPGGQTKANNHDHAMKSPGEDPAVARKAIEQNIQTHEEAAQKAQGGTPEHASEIKDGALDEYGKALHTVADRTSPAHTDSNGNPRDWNGIPTTPSQGEAVSQHNKEEATATPEQFESAVVAAQQAFRKTFGDAAFQDATTISNPQQNDQ